MSAILTLMVDHNDLWGIKTIEILHLKLKTYCYLLLAIIFCIQLYLEIQLILNLCYNF